MIRIALITIAIAFGFTGCEGKHETTGAPPFAKDNGAVRPVQNSEKPDITVATISKDVVGKVVTVPEISGLGPSDKWTFEADEYRRIDILDKSPTATGVDLLVFMLTRSRPGEGDIQVSGQLKLHYQWKGKQWVLHSIENLSFRYSLGVST